MQESSHLVGCCYFIVADLPEGWARSYRSLSTASVGSTASTPTAADISASSHYGGSGRSVGSIHSMIGGMGGRDLDAIRRDWLRFILFAKLCLIQLLTGHT